MCDRGFSRCALLDNAHHRDAAWNQVASGESGVQIRTSWGEPASTSWVQPFSGGVPVTSALVVSLMIAIGLTQVATFSTTIFLHRCATHRALTLHRRSPGCSDSR